MHLELDDNEVKVVRSALEHYRIKKSAERMLRGQAVMRQNDKSESDKVFAQYNVVLNVVKTLQSRIEA